MSVPLPDHRLRAVVAVPARDEEERVGACLRALAAQQGVEPACFEVVLVLDHCRDATGSRARAAAAELPGLRLIVLDCYVPGAGHARRIGMECACQRLLAAGAPDGLIASTDADSRVASDWLAVQLALAAEGARAIGGRIDLDPDEASGLAPGVLDARRVQARVRRAALGPGHEASGEHHHFSGASLAVTARTYLEVGGLPVGEALEDEGLQRALEDRGVAIVRSDRVTVTTSARTVGRASRGLAHDLALADWRARRSFRARDFDLAAVLERRTGPVSAILATADAAGTIEPILGVLAGLGEAGLIEEVVVVDAGSGDGTGPIAAARGATVHRADDLLADHGPSRGRGDAMWRGLSAARGDFVVFLDAETRGLTREMMVGLLGALLGDPEVRFVKGAGMAERVSELVARPLLNLYAPHLAGFDQPLAVEVAADAALLRSLPFPAGEGVEMANLIDAATAAGTGALAQVDLGGRERRRRALRDLSATSYAVMVAAAARLPQAGRAGAQAPGRIALAPAPGGAAAAAREVTILERPPLDSLAGGSRRREPERALVRAVPPRGRGDGARGRR